MPLQRLYNRLFAHYGPQHWWPADTPFEVVVGAILTQNTNWLNVERAIANLRTADVLDSAAIHRLPTAELEALIRPSGFFRQKADRLQQFTCFLHNNFRGDLQQLFALPLPELRLLLLAQNGIGPETADSILLYAAGKPSFVIDAYTHRLLDRLGLAQKASYDSLRINFMQHLPDSTELYKEFHALIVHHAKEHCRKRRPLCRACPLLDGCPFGQDLIPG